MISTPPTLAGLFFCLASTRCRAFILPGCNAASYKRLQRVLCCQCNYTAHATKQSTGLYSGFSDDYTRSTDHDTMPTKAAIIPPAPRWRVHTRPDTLNRYQIPPPRRDAVQVSAAAYYNKVYKRADLASGGGVSGQGGRRAARNHWRLPPHLFSGFRPIANRGQQ